MILLFLDIDGVLHPAHADEPTPTAQLFCHLPRFETIIRDFPPVKIVISSMWRYHFSLNELRTRFSPDIAARIIDTTAKDVSLWQCAETQIPAYRREREILDWLTATGNEITPWIALDDAVWQFNTHRDRLVACTWYRGIDDVAEAKLRVLLANVTGK
jgi:hypothetical protein